jgi:LacI family transcriptional regulator
MPAIRRSTLKDVAERANVSVTTVSVVLNGRQDGIRVPDATRERVRRAEEAAAENGHLLFVVNLDHVVGADLQRDAIDMLLQHQVAGFVFACMYHQEIEPPATLPDSTVFLNWRARIGPFRSIIPAEMTGAAAAVRVLLDAGHRRIGYLDDTDAIVASKLRLKGYLSALREYDVTPDPLLHVASQATVLGGVTGGGALLDLPADVRPSAIFCFNDRMAMGLYRAARHRGLSVPRDLSIVGFDDQEYIASELDPPLTTMRLPHAEMGRLAIEAALDLDTEYVEWKRGRTKGSTVAMLDCPVVERESVAQLPS